MLYSEAGASVLGFDFDLDDLRVERERTSSSELLESWSTSTKCVCVDRLGAALEGGRETRRCSVWMVVLVRCSGWGGGEGLRSSTKDWRVMRTSRGGGEGDRRTTLRTLVTRAGIGASSSLTLMRHMMRGLVRGSYRCIRAECNDAGG